MDAVAVAAGDEAEVVMRAETRENAAGAGDEFWIVLGVILAPDLVGGGPFVFRKFGGAIDAIPIRGIVFLEFGEGPGNAHGAKHGEVGGSVGGLGVEERAVPIEEDTFGGGIIFCGHFCWGNEFDRSGRKTKEGRRSAPLLHD